MLLASRRLRGQLQFASDYLHDFCVSLFGAAARVDYNDASRFPGGNRQICISHSAEESTTLLLEAIFIFSTASRVTPLIAAASAFNAGGNLRIHQDRELGFQIATQDMMKRQHRF